MRVRKQEYPTANCLCCKAEFQKTRSWMKFCCPQCRYYYYDEYVRPNKHGQKEEVESTLAAEADTDSAN